MSKLKSFMLLIAWLCLLPPSSTFAQERKIKPGDVIEIVVDKHEELSQHVIVGSDGKVAYPFLEGVPVDGITLQRLREVLVAQLSQAMDDRPMVVVRFAESSPIAVTVLGYVAKPGVYTIRNTSTLQSAIGEAGGGAPGAQLSQIKLIRMEKPGSSEVILRMSLFDVLALAGGATDQADLNHVKVIPLSGQNTRETRTINLKALLQEPKLKSIPAVAPGDVVYVPKSKNYLGKVVVVLRDLSTFASLYLLIRWERR